MSTDTLDSRIRQAVVQIVDTSPPPPRLDDALLRATRVNPRRRLVPALVGGAVAVAIVALVALIALVASRDNQHVTPARSAAPVAQLHVEALSTLSYGHDVWTVPAGRVHVRISGAAGQTFTIDSPTTRDLLLTTDAGGPHVATVTLRPGTYRMGSTIPGHRAAGMVATLHVLRRPVQWITPQGAADPSIVLPGMTTDVTGPPGPVGKRLEVLVPRFGHGDVVRVSLPDLTPFGQLGDVGRTIATYPEGDRFEVAAFRLPHPVSAATLGTGHATRFASTTGGSRLVFVDDLATVFLVRPDGAVARITKPAPDVGGSVTTVGLVSLAQALDRPALDRAVG